MKDWLARNTTVLLLFAGLSLITILVFLAAVYQPQHKELFAYLCGLGTGFSGSFFTAIRPDSRRDPPHDVSERTDNKE